MRLVDAHGPPHGDAFFGVGDLACEGFDLRW